MIKNKQINSYSTREHIRLRPGMYIGAVNHTGIHYLIIEVLRNLCEQNRSKTEIILDLSDEITILKFKGTVLNQVFCLSAENALKNVTEFGSNLLNDSQYNIIPVLFHLSSELKVSTNKSEIITLNEGKFDFNPIKIENEDWLNIHFKLDDEIFENTDYSRATLRFECEKLAALCSNVQIELLDNRNGCDYRERFTMEGGLTQHFNNRLESNIFESDRKKPNTANFHVKIKEPELSLELVFMPSTHSDIFENSYYRFLNLTEGGSHISYFKLRLDQLNEKLNNEFDSYDNGLKFYNLMTHIETKHAFPFLGPTKTRIEDPILVQIMKTAFDKLEPEIISFFSKEHTNSFQ
jgi:DNA gyrase/topoisomerase IV subunit B